MNPIGSVSAGEKAGAVAVGVSCAGLKVRIVVLTPEESRIVEHAVDVSADQARGIAGLLLVGADLVCATTAKPEETRSWT